jgi:hypothetical protein
MQSKLLSFPEFFLEQMTRFVSVLILVIIVDDVDVFVCDVVVCVVVVVVVELVVMVLVVEVLVAD